VPIWTVLGAHFFIPGDSLNWSKVTGLTLSFLGMIAVFGAGSTTLGPLYWVGDLMEVAAAIFWAATTIYIKKFIWNRPINHYQTLFAQLIFSVPILAVTAIIFEWGKPIDLNGTTLACLGYQTVVIAFFSYVLWFWMIHHFQVSRLAAFTFLTPIFGVILSGVFLGESLTVRLLAGLVLVAAGIYLVNRPASQNT
jgi:drug/metabolite transporter (DMT)-like permease